MALDALGWRITEMRPSSTHGPVLWIVTIERVDEVMSMSALHTCPDAALADLLHYVEADARMSS